jgi:hypothetical protein
MYAYPFTFDEHFTIGTAEAALEIERIPGDRRKGGTHYRLGHFVYQSVEKAID